jgi:3-hydroxyisobutyrate dehydrogenase-like beta-hydroxyacid dehydrogenase
MGLQAKLSQSMILSGLLQALNDSFVLAAKAGCFHDCCWKSSTTAPLDPGWWQSGHRWYSNEISNPTLPWSGWRKIWN